MFPYFNVLNSSGYFFIRLVRILPLIVNELLLYRKALRTCFFEPTSQCFLCTFCKLHVAKVTTASLESSAWLEGLKAFMTPPPRFLRSLNTVGGGLNYFQRDALRLYSLEGLSEYLTGSQVVEFSSVTSADAWTPDTLRMLQQGSE